MAKKSKPLANSSSLLTALEFCEPVMKTDGTASQTHVVLNKGWCVAFDGIVGIAHPIDEDLTCCPQFAPLKAVLKKGKENVAISLQDNGSLSVASGKLRATIRSAQYHQLMVTQPDANLYPLSDTLKDGFKILEKILKDDESNVILSSVLVKHSHMLATDAVLYVEYWHGNPMPELTLPKRLVNILSKLSTKIVGFGYKTDQSVTFYLENGAWIKSQLRSQTWPNMSAISDVQCNVLSQMDISMATAIDAVAPHSPDGILHFGSHTLRSHPEGQGEVGASYEFPGVPPGLIFNGAHLATVARLATAIQWQVPIRGHTMAGFVGSNVRGFLMSRAM